MPIQIDFTDVPSLDPIPEGTYPAEIVYAQEGVSQTGNPKIDVRWQVLSGEFEGRMIFDHLSFAANALWRTKKVLQSLGFPEEFTGEIDSETLVGAVADITVSIESGRTNPETGEAYDDRNRVVKVAEASTSVDDLLG